jgi:hypothetical protein
VDSVEELKALQAAFVYDASKLTVVGVYPGADLPVAVDRFLAANLNPRNACSNSNMGGMTLGLVVSQSGAVALPSGQGLEVARIELLPTSSAQIGDLVPFEFVDCLGPAGGEIANTAVGLDDGTRNAATIAGTLLVESVIFLRGNANGDDKVDIADPVRVFSYLFLGGDAPVCMDAADANDTGDLDITDGIYTLNWLFLGGPVLPPPAPGGACGVDPTSDSLRCLSNAYCP